MMDFRDWAAVVTAAVAIYGAGLSTYVAVSARRATQRSLRVSLSMSVLADAPEPRTVFMLSAANSGQRVVKLVMAVIRLPDGSQFVPLQPQLGNFLPCELHEGKSLEIPIAVEHVVQALKESGHKGRVSLRADFRDVLDTHYVSSPLRGKLDLWTRLANKGRAV